MVSYKKLIIPCIAIVAMVTMGCSLTDKIKESFEREVSEKVVENIVGEDVDVETDADGNITIETEDGTYSNDTKSLEKLTEYIDLPSWLISDSEKGDYVIRTVSEDGLSIGSMVHSEKSFEDTYTYWEEYFDTENYEDVTKSDVAGFYSIYGYKQDSTISLSVSVSEDSEDPSNVYCIINYTDQNITE